MIQSVKPVSDRRSGGRVLLCSSTPFFFSDEERRALIRLIGLQRDAFFEAETGLCRPETDEPLTAGDLAALEPLYHWLRR